ncbi:hypothetical protein V2J09_005957 [Rumex salicifolius]
MASAIGMAGTTSFLALQHVQFPLRRGTETNVSIGRGRGRKFLAVASMTMAKGSLGFSRGGAGVLERPSFDQSQFEPSTQVQEGGDMGSLKDRRSTGRGDMYRVLLLDDERHTENLVAKVLPQAVPSVTPDEARRLFDESRSKGLAVVITTVQEHAEFYAQMMMRGGLRSSVEPDSNTNNHKLHLKTTKKQLDIER